MKPTITMFCQDCGEQITGQFAASCRKCISSRAADNRHSLQQLKAEILALRKDGVYADDMYWVGWNMAIERAAGVLKLSAV